MLNILKELCSSKKYACIYTNRNETDKFLYGSIVFVDNEKIAVKMLSSNGEYDGIIVKSTHDVIKVETDGQYDEKMKKLCAVHTLPQIDIILKENDIMHSALLYALEKQELVSIELIGSGCNDAVGFIKEADNNQYKTELIDEYGVDNGFAYFSEENITQLVFGSEDEQRILTLWKATNGFAV